METFYQEVPTLNQGILYPFSIHLQQGFGKITMVNAHWHYYIELLYCTSGKAKVYISEKSYNFTAGDMVLINSREVHSVFGDIDDTIEYMVIKFDPNVLYSTHTTVFESKYVLPFTLSKSTHQKVFTDHEIRDTNIPKYLKEVLEENTAKAYGYEMSIRNNIGNIFLWILRSWHEKGLDLNIGVNLNENTLKKLQLIIDFVDKNYMEHISAESVAATFNMSYSYFSRFFKASFGKTFTSYLNYVRITEAEKLLISTDLTVTEIAMNIGFSSSSYFIDQFRRYKMVTPKQLRCKFKLI
ncbi:MAG: helix-turn-helix transcriptional regulator [Vallitaleaceae bacterium]|nr:helix-turn-helix transcriptional regulator [Vallitaleaceae bacterium]